METRLFVKANWSIVLFPDLSSPPFLIWFQSSDDLLPQLLTSVPVLLSFLFYFPAFAQLQYVFARGILFFLLKTKTVGDHDDKRCEVLCEKRMLDDYVSLLQLLYIIKDIV